MKQYIKPACFQADFNGDGVTSVAALIIEKKTKKKGILVIQGGTFEYVIFGAGNNVGKASFDGSDDLKWMEGWEIFNHNIAYETKFDNGDIIGSIKRKLPHKGISIRSLEDGEPLAGGIIYWDRKK